MIGSRFSDLVVSQTLYRTLLNDAWNINRNISTGGLPLFKQNGDISESKQAIHVNIMEIAYLKLNMRPFFENGY